MPTKGTITDRAIIAFSESALTIARFLIGIVLANVAVRDGHVYSQVLLFGCGKSALLIIDETASEV
jgi:hypothetical protein